MIQKTLFDELNEVSKKPAQVEKPLYNPSVLYNNDTIGTFEELEGRIASQNRRYHIGFPCDIAQNMPLDDRPEHMKNCDECKRLEKELDEKIGAVGRGVWYV
jgi:hypothetical protein